MRLRETPETEAAIIDELDVELVATGSGRWKGDTKMQLVPADFARKLERERDEALYQLKVIDQSLHAALYREGELKKELSNLREAYNDLIGSDRPPLVTTL